MFCLAVICCLAVSYALYQARFHAQRRKLMRRSWEDLISAVQPVNIAGVTKVALSYLNPTSDQLCLQPFEMWQLIGKQEGIKALNANAQSMLDLAVYAAQFDRVEGRIIGEMMRRDAVRLKRATRHIQAALVSEKAAKFAAFELQEAAAAYHLMRARLHGLYESVHVGLYSQLAATI